MKLRVRTLFVVLFLAGCERSTQTASDLTPYLQLTQGTPVIIHVIATNSTAGKTVDLKAQGTLSSVTRDMVRIRSRPDEESVGYPKEIVRRIEVAP